jgi:hypothetical protein
MHTTATKSSVSGQAASTPVRARARRVNSRLTAITASMLLSKYGCQRARDHRRRSVPPPDPSRTLPVAEPAVSAAEVRRATYRAVVAALIASR